MKHDIKPSYGTALRRTLFVSIAGFLRFFNLRAMILSSTWNQSDGVMCICSFPCSSRAHLNSCVASSAPSFFNTTCVHWCVAALCLPWWSGTDIVSMFQCLGPSPATCYPALLGLCMPEVTENKNQTKRRRPGCHLIAGAWWFRHLE